VGTSLSRIEEILDYASDTGDMEAQRIFGISHETLRRYRRRMKLSKEPIKGTAIGFDPSVERMLQEIGARYSPEEIRIIAQGMRPGGHGRRKITADWFTGDSMTFGVISDTHIGSRYFREDWFDGAIEMFARRNVDFVVHSGDVTEGLSNRPGHVYELSHIGYAQQKEEAIRQIGKIECPCYIVDGNHDRWFMKSAGAQIVDDICKDTPNARFIGTDEGVIDIGGISILLWHGEDGAAYALSYRVQKIVESLSGGQKPNILVTGHDHKQGYFFTRNVQVVMAGCLQEQTPWMRSKRLAAHPGFWIVEVGINNGSIVEFVPHFFPFYE